MSRILRRVYTTATTSVADAIPSAKQVAERFLSDLKGLTRTRRQVLDGNQLRKLATLLGRLDNEAAFRVGERIPPCYHLAYFTPEEREEELGVDGTDKTWNPGWPFTRRMWAGGEMEWLGGREVRVGDEVKERTEVINAEGKKTKAGEEMVVVGVRKEYSGEGEGVHLVDKRYVMLFPLLMVINRLTNFLLSTSADI
jgi:hydroxyacyl-ACP dehydratase HTD2-like protein with hotdog domain